MFTRFVVVIISFSSVPSSSLLRRLLASSQIVLPHSYMSHSRVKSHCVQPSKRIIVLIWRFGSQKLLLAGSTDQETSNFKRIEQPHSFSFRPLYMKLRSQPVAVVVGEGNPLHPPFPLLTDLYVLFMILYPASEYKSETKRHFIMT